MTNIATIPPKWTRTEANLVANLLNDYQLRQWDKDAHFIVSLESTKYKAVSGATGKVVYGGSSDEGGIDGDDAEAVTQAAIDATSTGSSGGKVVIKPTPYLTPYVMNLELKDKVALCGGGYGTKINGQITAPERQNVGLFDLWIDNRGHNAPVLDLSGTKRFYCHGLKLEGDSVSYPIVNVTGGSSFASWLKWRNCEIIGPHHGIHFSAGSLNSVSLKDILFFKTGTSKESGKYGIYNDAPYNLGLSIQDCYTEGYDVGFYTSKGYFRAKLWADDCTTGAQMTQDAIDTRMWELDVQTPTNCTNSVIMGAKSFRGYSFYQRAHHGSLHGSAQCSASTTKTVAHYMNADVNDLFVFIQPMTAGYGSYDVSVTSTTFTVTFENSGTYLFKWWVINMPRFTGF